MRIVFSGDAGLHLCKYYFCAPSPLPPVHICKGRRGQVSSDDQQASAGRGRRLSELCSRPPSPFLGSTQAGAPGRPAGSGVAACQTCPLRQARTIALLLPAGGGGCYNIHIPPRHRHFSYCDLWPKCVNSPSPQSCSSDAPFSCTAQGFGVTQKMLRDIWCQLSKLSEQDENLLSSSLCVNNFTLRWYLSNFAFMWPEVVLLSKHLVLSWQRLFNNLSCEITSRDWFPVLDSKSFERKALGRGQYCARTVPASPVTQLPTLNK